MGYLLKQFKKRLPVIIMLVPFFSLFFVFTVYPVLRSMWYSFTYYNVFTTPEFIGFDNYIRLFLQDSVFLTALKNTLIFAIITGPVGYLLSLLVAWLINDLSPKVRWFLTLVFYAPSISGAAVAIWTFVFSADRHGYANSFLLQLGLLSEPLAWFKDPRYVLMTIIVVQLWMSLGTSFLAFIAGLQGVNPSLYEAGAVEGIRNKWQELWHITLPAMKPQLMFGAVMQITAAFSVSDISVQLAGFPSVEYAAHTIVTHLQDYGMIRFEFGYASAIATVLFVMMIAANQIVQAALRRVGE
ncbi:MAG TPA: ABC transporter permease [Ruminococcaceae bacterium]|jgi:multiple sugar transport system permease protein|nr:ABC transporter permease [Oscillospiraceae bacterium]